MGIPPLVDGFPTLSSRGHGCSGEGVILRRIADDPEREIRGMVDPHAIGIHDKLGVQGVTNRPDAVQAAAAIVAADGTN